MSEPKIEEMLKWLEEIKEDIDWDDEDIDEDYYQAICRLIKQGEPKITEEEFMELSCELWGEETGKGFREALKEILERLGMEISDVK